MTTTESETQTANIQIVDDKPQNLAILTAVLAQQGYKVRTAISGSLAIKSAQKRSPDLILLDVMMPDMDGYQVCQRLKADERTRDIPVIFVIALDEVVDKVKALAVGGVDYITKPFQEEEVLARVETHLALRRAQMNLKETNTQLQELSHDLGERVKELNCLYGISKLVETPGISLEGILQGTADLIPPGWHYPEITCARISLDGQVFSTQDFQKTPWQQEAIILVHGERCGTVQVGYLEKRPESDEGPFLKEERNLINIIANRLGSVAERMRAEQQVGQQHQFLQNILDSLSHPFYVIDAQDWTVQLANRAAYAGTLSEGITCHALMHGRDRPCDTESPCPLQEVRRTKKPAIVEHLHIDAEGRRRDVEVHGFPVLDRGANVVQMIEYTLDITERKQAEQMLLESEEKFRSLAENSQDYIMRYDAQCRHLYENPAALRVSGLTEEEIIGKTHREAGFGEEMSEQWEDKIGRVFQTGEPSQTTFEWERAEGTVYLDWRLYPELDQGGNVKTVLGISRDITERVNLEAQNERLAVLEERERIGRELHDDLAQVIGHINIQAQAAAARLEHGQGAQAQAILAQLVRAAQEAYSNVRQYILGIRRPAPTGAATGGAGDLFAALNHYLDTLRQRYGLEVRVSLPDDMLQSPLAPEVETHLLRIIQEALTNVGLHAGVDTARLLFTLHGDEMQVVIADDGCGFEAAREPGDSGIRRFENSDADSPDHESRITSHGSRTTHHFGLAIMRERAESVGGRLEIRSAPREGTRVIARVPLPLPGAAPSPEEGEAISGLRVLLADDHPLYLEGLRGLLSARGVQVVGMARDGLEAQELARDLLPDLILMDVQMPRCDGVEATRRIKAELPEIKIVMLSMAADGKALFGALKSGASGYLLKSLDGAQFFSLLAGVMRGETVISPALANLLLSEFAPEPAGDTEETATLTARQREVLDLVARGLSNKEIAAALHVSEATVKYHVSLILERLHLQSRYQLAAYSQE